VSTTEATDPTRPSRPRGYRFPLLPWPVALAIVVLLHVVGGWFAFNLSFNNSPDVYYPRDSPAVTVRAELRRTFPSDEVLTVLFKGNDLYTVAFLKKLDAMVNTLERHPLVDRAIAITSMERISATRDGFVVGKLVDVSALKRDAPAELKKRVLADRFAPGGVASKDGEYLAVAVRPKKLTESGQRLALKIAAARAINDAGLRPYYAGDAGPVSIDVAQLESILNDSATFVPLTVALGLALMWWVVGRWRPVVIGGIAMSTVILPTIGAISIAGEPYTMATAILPSLLAAYTSATLLHFFSAIQQGHALGLNRGRSLERALEVTFWPSVFNVLTTGAGLMSLILVPIPPIQVFGVASAFGTLMVFITVFFLVPPFLRHWDNRRWPVKSSGMGRLGRFAPRLAAFSLRHPKLVIGASLALVVVCVPLALKVEVESDLLAFFRPDHPISRDTRLIESKLSGVTSLELSLVAEGDDDLQSVAVLKRIRGMQRWLEALPEVDRAVSFADVVEEMHWAMNGERPRFRAIPENEKLLRQYLLVYDGRDLFELVDRDFRHARVLLSLNVHGARSIEASIDKIRQYLKDNPLPGVKIEIGGEGRLFADQSDLLVTGQLNSFAGSFGQIFIIMALLWRSLRAAAICMVPNLAPLFFVFVLMGALGVHIDLATVMIAGVVLGITVDDTIHIYHGYAKRRKAGASAVFAIARSFETAGPAVMSISILLVSQFCLLGLSDFIPTSNFGWMTAIGLFSGQFFELLLLPALLLLTDRRSTARVASTRPASTQS
jgi:predicted RND superfamily exporter protein